MASPLGIQTMLSFANSPLTRSASDVSTVLRHSTNNVPGVFRRLAIPFETRGLRAVRSSRVTELCAYQRDVTLNFSRPGKPTGNAFIEAFSGQSKAGCLNTHWSSTLADAAEKLEAWRRYYNNERPNCHDRQQGPDHADKIVALAAYHPNRCPENSAFRRSSVGRRIKSIWYLTPSRGKMPGQTMTDMNLTRCYTVGCETLMLSVLSNIQQVSIEMCRK